MPGLADSEHVDFSDQSVAKTLTMVVYAKAVNVEFHLN